MKSRSAFDPDALRTREIKTSSRHANAGLFRSLPEFISSLLVKFFFTGLAGTGKFSGSREETKEIFRRWSLGGCPLTWNGAAQRVGAWRQTNRSGMPA